MKRVKTGTDGSVSTSLVRCGRLRGRWDVFTGSSWVYSNADLRFQALIQEDLKVRLVWTPSRSRSVWSEWVTLKADLYDCEIKDWYGGRAGGCGAGCMIFNVPLKYAPSS